MRYPQTTLHGFYRLTDVLNVLRKVSDHTIDRIFGPDVPKKFTIRKWMKLGEEGSWARVVYGLCIAYSFWSIWTLIAYFNAGAQEGLSNFRNAVSAIFHSIIVLSIFVVVILDRPKKMPDVSLSKEDLGELAEPTEEALGRARSAIARLFRFWPFVWVFWFLLYLCLAANSFLLHAGYPPDHLWIFNPLVNMLNNLTALVLLSMYYELTERTVDEDSPEGVWMIYLLIVLSFAFAEIMLEVLNLGDKEVLRSIVLTFTVMSGLLTGLATTLVATRLASRLLGVPTSAIVVLMLFAVVQPLFPMVSDPHTLAEAFVGYFAVNVALYGKATIVVILHWLRSSHRLTYYMIRALQQLHEEEIYRRIFVVGFVSAEPEKGAGKGVPGEAPS